MREIGKVVKIEGNQATISFTRGTACGECGKCQVGKDKLEMMMTAENDVGAQVGDEVEISLKHELHDCSNYCIWFPLLGTTAEYLAVLRFFAMGAEDIRRSNRRCSGTCCIGCFLFDNKFKDKSIKKMKKFKLLFLV